jgi:hypothetical protein
MQIGEQTSDTTDDLEQFPRAAPAPVRAPVAASGQTPRQAIGALFQHAVPDVGVLATLLVGAIVLLQLLRRMPRDYPLRGAAVGFTALGALGVGVLLAARAWPAAGAVVTQGRAAYDSAHALSLRQRPVEPLESYVPLYPGASPAAQVPSTSRWEATTTAPVSAVAAFYHADPHHAGWKVELSAASGVVLMHPTEGGEERLRIQAFHGHPTRIEYELRRHIP